MVSKTLNLTNSWQRLSNTPIRPSLPFRWKIVRCLQFCTCHGKRLFRHTTWTQLKKQSQHTNSKTNTIRKSQNLAARAYAIEMHMKISQWNSYARNMCLRERTLMNSLFKESQPSTVAHAVIAGNSGTTSTYDESGQELLPVLVWANFKPGQWRVASFKTSMKPEGTPPRNGCWIPSGNLTWLWKITIYSGLFH